MREEAKIIIQQGIKRGKAFEDIDKKIFTEYIRGKYTIAETKNRFRINNEISSDDFEEVSDEDFKQWLKSIGWERAE